MAAFLDDVRTQGQLIRDLVANAQGDERELARAERLVPRSSPNPVLLVGMGSSLAAAVAVVPVLAANGRLAFAVDAGELLHYGLHALAPGTTVIAISQSGRSAETVRLAEHARQRDASVIAVVNDLDSPLARTAHASLQLHAGDEDAVATRTYAASVVQLHRLVMRLTTEDSLDSDLLMASREIDRLAMDTGLGPAAAAHLASCDALLIVGRGPALSAASCGALTIKETAAFPAEAMTGASFRHGPVELAEGPVGVIVLAPDGPTHHLNVRLAVELAQARTATWLIASAAGAGGAAPADYLLVTESEAARESLAPLSLVVPLQLLAFELAERANRVAGVFVRASKVTVRE